MSAQSLHKSERLSSKNDIDRLLTQGRFFVVDNILRCCVLPRVPLSGALSARMMVSVPKKCFKRAVKRNLLKRRIREAYRRHKPSLPMDILFVYLPKEILSYEQIESAVIKAIEKATERISKMSAPATSGSATTSTASKNEVVAPEANRVPAVLKWILAALKWILAALKWIGNAPFLLLISFYRACVSPFTPPACRFTPTCSQYAMEAFKKYGPFKGLYLTVKRIVRCRPGGGSGYDPVP